MTDAELIELLKTQEPKAVVVLGDRATYEGELSKLGFGEIRPIQLGARECNGLLLFEAWGDSDDELQGSFPGVALGRS